MVFSISMILLIELPIFMDSISFWAVLTLTIFRPTLYVCVAMRDYLMSLNGTTREYLPL